MRQHMLEHRLWSWFKVSFNSALTSRTLIWYLTNKMEVIMPIASNRLILTDIIRSYNNFNRFLRQKVLIHY